MSAAKANGVLPSSPPGGLWLRLRRWVGTVAWGAYRGDNPGILIGAMLILIAIFAYLLRDTGFMSPIQSAQHRARVDHHHHHGGRDRVSSVRRRDRPFDCGDSAGLGADHRRASLVGL